MWHDDKPKQPCMRVQQQLKMSSLHLSRIVFVWSPNNVPQVESSADLTDFKEFNYCILYIYKSTTACRTMWNMKILLLLRCPKRNTFRFATRENPQKRFALKKIEITYIFVISHISENVCFAYRLKRKSEKINAKSKNSRAKNKNKKHFQRKVAATSYHHLERSECFDVRYISRQTGTFVGLVPFFFWILPFLNASNPESLLSCIPPFLHPSFPASLLSCIPLSRDLLLLG